MSPVELEFDELRAEVDLFFAYLARIDHDGSALVGVSLSKEPFNREFKTILKANALLLLYHLIEATVQRTVDGIAEAVAREKAGYADVSDKVRRLWSSLVVRQLRKASEDKWTEHLNDALDDCLKREILILNGREVLRAHSGNIDASSVKAIAETFGLELICRPEARGGNDLDGIKSSRNHLAHGVKRFTQVGGETTVSELSEMKDRVVCFLQDLIRCTDAYVTAKRFKHAAVATA